MVDVVLTAYSGDYAVVCPALVVSECGARIVVALLLKSYVLLLQNMTSILHSRCTYVYL